MARIGRRPGESTTRAAILAAARDAFSASAYDAVTVRRIAAAAAVDPALIHYHFGTKERLFRAVVHDALPPADLLARAFADGPETSGEELVERFLALWEQGDGAAAGTLLRSAMSGEPGARLAGQIVLPVLTDALSRTAATPPVGLPLRASLIAGQICGLVVARYVLEFEPLAGASREEVARAVGPALDWYLTGDLPRAGSPGRGRARQGGAGAGQAPAGA